MEYCNSQIFIMPLYTLNSLLNLKSGLGLCATASVGSLESSKSQIDCLFDPLMGLVTMRQNIDWSVTNP